MIEKWLQEFKNNWKRGEVDNVLELFSDDVDYYETPSQKLSREELCEEWKTVREQKEVELEFNRFSSCQNKHAVQWGLSYRKNGTKNNLEGIYLIELNEDGECVEFWQYIQQE